MWFQPSRAIFNKNSFFTAKQEIVFPCYKYSLFKYLLYRNEIWTLESINELILWKKCSQED